MRRRAFGRSRRNLSYWTATGSAQHLLQTTYCLFRRIPLKSIVLQPGETDNVMWASFGKVDWMIRTGKMCRIIGHQFYRQEKALRLRNMPKFGR